LTDEEIAKAVHCHRNTVFNVRQRLVEDGLEAALERKKRETPPVARILDGEKEARLIFYLRTFQDKRSIEITTCEFTSYSNRHIYILGEVQW